MKINELQQVPKNIERKFHEASGQASSLILDLRRIKRPTNESENDALKEFKKSSRIKHMLLITKNRKLLLKLKKIVNTSAFDKIVINTKHNYTKEELCQKELARPRSMVIFYQTLIS